MSDAFDENALDENHANGETPCEKVAAFAAGALPAAEAESFRLHLAGCAGCERALFELAMHEALTSELRGDEVREPASPTRASPAPVSPEPVRVGAPRTGAPVVSLASARRKYVAVAAVVAASLAAAASWLVAVRARDSSVAIATGPTRSLEARLTHPSADQYRPYDVARGAHGAEGVSLEALAHLEKHQDLRGVAAGLVLRGDPASAESYLARLPDSPDVEADRAAVLLTEGKLDVALVHADAALERAPSHPQALWNRGLVLRDMGLRLGAARAFDAVAALGEPGWSGEAKARADALRAQETDRAAEWKRAKDAGAALLFEGKVPPSDLLRAQPSLLRHFFYHAVQSAPSRERVQALLPLASTLDGIVGGDVLGKYVARVLQRDFAVRGPIGVEYRRLYEAPQAFTPAAVRALVERARKAGEDDQALGLILLSEHPEAYAAEMAKLAARRADPWWTARADDIVAKAAIEKGDYAAAEQQLRSGLAACEAAKVGYACGLLEAELSKLLLTMHRTEEARAVASRGLLHVRQHSRDFERMLESVLGDVARLEGAFAPMRAWLEESALRTEDCAPKRWVSVAVAYAQAVSGLFDDARKSLEGAPACSKPPGFTELELRVQLDRMGLLPLPEDLFRRGLAAVRETEAPAFGDMLEGLYLASHGVPAGTAMLERLTHDRDPKIASVARSILGVEAGRRGDAEEVLELASTEMGVEPKRACVVAVVANDERVAVAYRGNDGPLGLRYTVYRDGFPPFSKLLPPDVVDAVRGCDEVAVVAPAPVHGTPRLFPESVAWAYVSKRRAAGERAGGERAVAPRHLVVADVVPPSSLKLPRLSRWARPAGAAGDPAQDLAVDLVEGEAATPSRVLAEMGDATEIEIHAHGLVDLAVSEASFLALSPEADGRFGLTAGQIRRSPLRGRPVVLLAACSAARTVPHHHEPWSMPMAFVAAGARAVFGSAAPVPDAAAPPFFRAVLERIRAGEEPAIALRNERRQWISRPDGAWVADVLAFQ